MDGHPHRCSTDFEQTLPGGHLARRDVGVSTSSSGYVPAFREAGVPLGEIRRCDDINRRILNPAQGLEIGRDWLEGR
jgi:hypothetical protein